MKRLLAALALCLLPVLGNSQSTATPQPLDQNTVAALIVEAAEFGYEAGQDNATGVAQELAAIAGGIGYDAGQHSMLHKVRTAYVMLERMRQQLVWQAGHLERQAFVMNALKEQNAELVLENLEALVAHQTQNAHSLHVNRSKREVARLENEVEIAHIPDRSESDIKVSEIEAAIPKILRTSLKRHNVTEVTLRSDNEDRCIVVQPEVWAKDGLWASKVCRDMQDYGQCMSQIQRQHQLPDGWDTEQYVLSSAPLCFPVEQMPNEHLYSVDGFYPTKVEGALQQVVQAIPAKQKTAAHKNVAKEDTAADLVSEKTVTIVVPVTFTPPKEEFLVEKPDLNTDCRIESDGDCVYAAQVLDHEKRMEMYHAARAVYEQSQQPITKNVQVVITAEAHEALERLAAAANTDVATALISLKGSCKTDPKADTATCNALLGENAQVAMSPKAATSLKEARALLKQVHKA